MTYEETEIVRFLNESAETFLARREIARKAINRAAFEENPHWADAPLASLLAQRLVEQDDSGHYRIKGYEG